MGKLGNNGLRPNADDIFLFHPISFQSDICLLQSDLDSISSCSWLSSQFQLSASKSKLLLVEIQALWGQALAEAS